MKVLDDIVQRQAELEAKLQGAEARHEVAVAAASDAQSLLSDAVRKHQLEAAACDELGARAAELELAEQALQAQLETSLEEKRSIESALASANERAGVLAASEQSAHARVHAYEVLAAERGHDIDSLQSQLDSTTEALTAAKATSVTLQEQLSQTRRTEQALQAQLDAVLRDKKSVGAALAAKSQQEQALAASLRNALARVQVLEAQVAERQSESEKLKAALESTTASLHAAEATSATLRERLAEAERIEKAIKAKLEATTASLQAAEANGAKLRERLTRVQRDDQAARTQLSRALDDKRSVEAALASMSERQRALAASAEGALAQVQALETLAAERQQDSEALRATFLRLSQSSWAPRADAPLPVAPDHIEVVSQPSAEASAALRNSGQLVCWLESGVDAASRATIIVVGTGRSGTSMVAGVLRALGAYIGEKIDEAVLEDQEIAGALDNENWDAFRTIVDSRNRNYLHWGFKRPNAYSKASKFIPLLRNPRLIVTMRDCVAVGVRNSISIHTDPFESTLAAARGAIRVIESVKGIDCPVMFASYEKALFEPSQFVQSVAEFCGLTPTSVARKAALEIIQNGPEVYLSRALIEFDGAFKVSSEGNIDAWLMTNAAFPKIEIMDGSTVLGEAVVVGKIARPADAMKTPISDPVKIRYSAYKGQVDPALVSPNLALRVKGTIYQLRRDLSQSE
jgi:hypothetical protein